MLVRIRREVFRPGEFEQHNVDVKSKSEICSLFNLDKDNVSFFGSDGKLITTDTIFDNFITVVQTPAELASIIGIGVPILSLLFVTGVGTYFVFVKQNENRLKNSKITYSNSLRGATNPIRSNGNIGILLGEYNVPGDVAGLVYSSYVSNDQYIHQLFCNGYDNTVVKTDSEFISDNNPNGYKIRVGQTPIDLYSDIKVGLGTEKYYTKRSVEEGLSLTMTKEAIIRTSPTNTIKINVGIAAPYGYFGVKDNGDKEEISLKYTIKYRKQGTTDWIDSKTVDESIYTKRYRNMVSFDVPRGQYEVSITRDNDKSEDASVQDNIILELMQYDTQSAINDSTAPVINPEKYSLLEIKAKATDKLNGYLDQVYTECFLKCKCFTGNEPSEDNSLWQLPNDITSVGDMNNPASLLYYVLTDSRINPRAVTPDKLDLLSISEWFLFCKEREWSCNAWITENLTIGELAQRICDCGRANLTIMDGKYSVNIEKANSVVSQIFAPNNAWNMTETRSFEKQPTLIKTSFLNQDTEVEEERYCYLDKDSNEIKVVNEITNEESYESESITLWGVTNPTQVAQLAIYNLKLSNAIDRTYSWECAIESIACAIGDVVYLANDIFMFSLGYGRIIDTLIENNKIVGCYINTSVGIDTSKNYGINVRKNDGSIQTIDIDMNTSTTSLLRFKQPLDNTHDSIISGNLFIYGDSSEVGKKVVITDIQPNEDMGATITAIDYVESIYDDSDVTIPEYVSNVSKYGDGVKIGSGNLPPITPPEGLQGPPGKPTKTFELYATPNSYQINTRNDVETIIQITPYIQGYEEVIKDITVSDKDITIEKVGDIYELTIPAKFTKLPTKITEITEPTVITEGDEKETEEVKVKSQKAPYITVTARLNEEVEASVDIQCLPDIANGMYLGKFDKDDVPLAEDSVMGDYYVTLNNIGTDEEPLYVPAIYLCILNNDEKELQFVLLSPENEEYRNRAMLVLEDMMSLINDGNKTKFISSNLGFFKNIVSENITTETLTGKKINITDGGAIYGGAYDKDGNTTGESDTGFFISEDGLIKADKAILNNCTVNNVIAKSIEHASLTTYDEQKKELIGAKEDEKGEIKDDAMSLEKDLYIRSELHDEIFGDTELDLEGKIGLSGYELDKKLPFLKPIVSDTSKYGDNNISYIGYKTNEFKTDYYQLPYVWPDGNKVLTQGITYRAWEKDGNGDSSADFSCVNKENIPLLVRTYVNGPTSNFHQISRVIDGKTQSITDSGTETYKFFIAFPGDTVRVNAFENGFWPFGSYASAEISTFERIKNTPCFEPQLIHNVWKYEESYTNTFLIIEKDTVPVGAKYMYLIAFENRSLLGGYLDISWNVEGVAKSVNIGLPNGKIVDISDWDRTSDIVFKSYSRIYIYNFTAIFYAENPNGTSNNKNLVVVGDKTEYINLNVINNNDKYGTRTLKVNDIDLTTSLKSWVSGDTIMAYLTSKFNNNPITYTSSGTVAIHEDIDIKNVNEVDFVNNTYVFKNATDNELVVENRYTSKGVYDEFTITNMQILGDIERAVTSNLIPKDDSTNIGTIEKPYNDLFISSDINVANNKVTLWSGYASTGGVTVDLGENWEDKYRYFIFVCGEESYGVQGNGIVTTDFIKDYPEGKPFQVYLTNTNKWVTFKIQDNKLIKGNTSSGAAVLKIIGVKVLC